ncbi:MAG TPA: polymer-forming cytoskeletal protein [Flavisolibacter sp.]|jgi:cytoskeletal protein CcmA (bactofilin family)|nr:polymer-forming cytoskeletal protein [Flavisolibacter sp.]HZH96125.1 polymer-forming cytoskeletal protein [Flavisolibacter sp.]
MFNKEKNAQADKAFSNSATLISAGTVLNGDLKSESDLRIDGTIHGDVISQAKVVIGPSGMVEGNIEGINADISGKLVGNVKAKEMVQLRTKCYVQGNISAGSLQIDAGAVFNGQSLMESTSNVVVMKEGEIKHAKAN